MKKVMFSLFMFSSFSFGIELSEINSPPYPQWVDMLEREGINCGSKPDVYPGEAVDYFVLRSIVRKLSKRFKNVPDRKKHDTEDYWEIPNVAGSRPIEGDCEEYAIAARLILWEAGFTNTRLLVAEITSGFASGGGHAVLLVDDKYIVDSMRAGRITTLKNSKRYYRYIAASNYGWCGGWSAVLSQ